MTHFIANTLPSGIDLRDIPFVPRPGITIPDRLDQMPDVFEVEDQLDVGACVPNGMGSQIESMLMLAGRPRDLARMAWYTMTLKYENRLGEEGLAPRDALYVARHMGVCDESKYPYDTSKRAVDPPQSIYDEAFKTRADRYEWVVPFGSNWNSTQKIDYILSAMNEGHRVGFALPVSDSIRHLVGPWQTHNYLPVSSTVPSIGGHYMVFAGFDLAIGKFLVQNSWGTKKPDGTPYGDGGFIGMPFSIVEHNFFESNIIRSFDGAEIPEEPGIKLEVVNLYRLEARIIPKPAEVGSVVKLWAGAKIDGKLYLKTSEADTWAEFDGSTFTPFKSLTLEKDNPIKIINWTNLSQYAGAEVYLAYGSDPLSWTLAKVCTVPEF